MILLIYQGICACIAAVIIWNLLFRAKDFQEKVLYGFVLVPFVLRALLLK